MIYCDYNATSPLRALVKSNLIQNQIWGNPSALYAIGRQSRVAIEDARESLAALLGRDSRGLHFCSGGSEANQTFFHGLARRFDPAHLISTALEHPSVEENLKDFEKKGWRVSRVIPNTYGQVEVSKILELIQDDTRAISIMWANNETGVIQPITEICNQVKSKHPEILIHVDAVQALGKVSLDSMASVDWLSFSGHKIGAIKGIGAWWQPLDLDWPVMIYGGPQERDARGGTENVLGILSFAWAAQELFPVMEDEWKRVGVIRDTLAQMILTEIPQSHWNGFGAELLCNTLSISFEGCRGDLLLMGLDLQGIGVSTGSACSSGSAKPSRVLMNMGLTEKQARSTLRFSLGFTNKESDLDRILETLKFLVYQQR